MNISQIFKNLFTYFKRVKEPVKSVKEAQPIIRETKLYILTFAIIGVVAGVLSGLDIPFATVFSFIGFPAILITMYFGIMLYAIKRAMKRLDNLTCNECKTSLDNPEYATWEEISRRWAESSSDRTAEGKLYVTVKFTCKCPNCGETKCFTETLCSGKIVIRDHSSTADIMPTQKLVDDYFNGLIHA